MTDHDKSESWIQKVNDLSERIARQRKQDDFTLAFHPETLSHDEVFSILERQRKEMELLNTRWSLPHGQKPGVL